MFTIKRGDTRNGLKVRLLDVDNEPVNLNGSQVLFKVKNAFQRVPQILGDGWVLVVFQPSDVDRTGFFIGEILVTYPDGRKETFPNSGYIDIKIEANIKELN